MDRLEDQTLFNLSCTLYIFSTASTLSSLDTVVGLVRSSSRSFSFLLSLPPGLFFPISLTLSSAGLNLFLKDRFYGSTSSTISTCFVLYLGPTLEGDIFMFRLIFASFNTSTSTSNHRIIEEHCGESRRVS